MNFVLQIINLDFQSQFLSNILKLSNHKMRDQVLMALKNSLINDTNILKDSNQKLSQMSKNEGYCMCLMQIIDQSTFDLSLKQAALIQLKNNIKTKWKAKNDKIQLTPNEKNLIRNAMVLAIVRCAKNYMLIKLYREVLTTVIGYEYQSWIPLHDILNLLKTGENLSAVFHCIIAICTNFEFSVVDKQRDMYSLFLKQIMPAIFQIVKNNLQNSQLIYLSLKIVWKAVHYEVSNQIKDLLNDWMLLILQTIKAYNQDLQNKLDEIQTRNTPEFYYYHSKKWATRIITRFVSKHAKAFQFGKINANNLQYSNLWYQKYGIQICESIVEQLSIPVPTTKKIRYFQLKVIQGIIGDKPQIIGKYAAKFQYDILIKYLTLTPEDQKLANEDVVEYLRLDDQTGFIFSNIKGIATQVWSSFLQIGSKHDKEHNTYQPGPLFQENLQFMFAKISSENLLDRDLGMYLFCRNRMTINRVPLVKQKMPELIDKYVIPMLTSSAMLIRARANDFLFQYGKQIHDFGICSRAIEGMFLCLTEDPNPLVKIKAAIALNPLMSHQQSKKALSQKLKVILQVYLKLIEQYDLEQVVAALQYFISDFAESIGPYAIDLFRYLSDIFKKMFNKDIQQSQNDQYNNQIELAASGCIKTMTQIIESPLEQTVRSQIQVFVLDICAFLFTNESYDYFEDMMYLLRVHVERADKITQHCWLFYQIIIYFIVGIPVQTWNQINSMNIPDKNKQLFASVRRGDNFEYLEHAVPVLRNFLGKGYEMILAHKDQFKHNLVMIILHMVNQVYNKANPKEYEGQIHYDCASIMVVYLLETFPSEMTAKFVLNIYGIIKFNFNKLKSIYIKQINCQLMAVLLWKHPQIFLQVLMKQNQLKMLYLWINKIANTLEEFQERKRLILGICTYLLIVQKQVQILGPEAPNLFKILLRLVRKNCRTRIIVNTKQPNLKKQILQMSDQDSDQENEDQEKQEQDDEDLWDEQYSQKHVSILRRINELQYFKETIEKLNSQNHKIYPILISEIPQERLQNINELLQRAINLPQR